MEENNQKKMPEEVEPAIQAEAEAPAKPSLVLASEILPDRIPILPIRPRPFFPGLPVPIEIHGEQLPLLQHAIESSNETLGLVLVRDSKGPDAPENLHRVGVAAKLLRAIQTESESAHVLVNCLQRFTIENLIDTAQG